MKAIKDLVNRFVRDKHGKVAVWQVPNWPIISWAFFTFLASVAHGGLHTIFGWLGFIAIFVWAMLEIIKGDSYFRRVLGLVVLAVSIYGRLR